MADLIKVSYAQKVVHPKFNHTKKNVQTLPVALPGHCAVYAGLEQKSMSY